MNVTTAVDRYCGSSCTSRSRAGATDFASGRVKRTPHTPGPNRSTMVRLPRGRFLTTMLVACAPVLFSPRVVPAQNRQSRPKVRREVHRDVSRPLRDIRAVHEPAGAPHEMEQEIAEHAFAPDQTDPVLQTSAGPL